MVQFICLFILPAVIQVVTSQGPDFRGPPPPIGVPEKCTRPPTDVKRPQDCCEISPIFDEEDFKSCGVVKIERSGDEPGPPPPPPDCSKQECLLARKGFMNGDSINYGAIMGYMNTWSDNNPNFKNAADTAKGTCLVEGGPPGPPHICEANRLMFCIGAIMFSNCPVENWVKTDECTRIKTHMEECRFPYQ